MKTMEQIVQLFKSKALDGRDLDRLAQFMSVKDMKAFGIKFKEKSAEKEWKPVPFTRDNVLKQLEKDVEFAFEKALNKRGLSSSAMHDVVSMWNWVLEEGLEDPKWEEDENYAQYGLPYFKATALKYGFNNPIGNDNGNEHKYSSDD